MESVKHVKNLVLLGFLNRVGAHGHFGNRFGGASLFGSLAGLGSEPLEGFFVL
ncbi:MAG: hypothetical protein ACD_75C01085G0001, partial [uncultured bacterium]